MRTTLKHQNRIFLMLSEGEDYTQVILSHVHPDSTDSSYFDTQPQVSVTGNKLTQLKKIFALRTALVTAGFNVIDC